MCPSTCSISTHTQMFPCARSHCRQTKRSRRSFSLVQRSFQRSTPSPHCVTQQTATTYGHARDDVPRPGGGKRASAAYVLVAGKQRTVPAADLPTIKGFLRKHSIEMANTRLGLQATVKKDGRSQSVVTRKRRQAMIATATEAETRKKVVGKQALISELMRSTKFNMHDIFQMSCQFKELARENGTISCDDFATIIGSHLGKLVGSVSHTSAIDEATIHGNGVSSIGETISMSNALVKRLYGVFDQDLNGAIDFREFILGMNSLVQGTLEQKLDALFKMYDKDGSGTISISELVLILNGGQEKMSQLAIYIDDYFAHVDTNGDAVITEDEFVQAASVEPLVLEALSKPLTFNRHTNFQLRQSLRCITERLKLDWSVMLSILEDVNDATRLDRDAAAHDRAWLVKTNQADPAPYEAVAAPLTSAQFHNIMFEYLHEPQAEDGHTLQDLFKAYVPQQAPADPKNRGKANCRDFIRDLAGMLRMLVVDTTHDEACSRFYFRFFDYDCDGEITREELSSVVCSSFGSMGHELLETMRLLQGIDTNGDGELTKEEYLEAAKKNPLLLASIYICI
ncbi:hypothetical protein, variant 1 [Aphanomyces invadans]|uniref:EF-hand domain-containing protein n=1 Tax=Aphanomyces invadans TaxID=157072 RepID=A0A024ULR5_9STRA|nr:hypothetical protein, variant 1 [Aphanomyces invadans]ETW07125.1 hypothetical protein, variant 1 [Aphanomyces invadans]|eukprot:XP_008863218.1 hypothetical protein, variant 1 [Aphanomyces invadans]